LNLPAQPEGEYTVKKVILAVVILAAASACTVRSERTVVEKPVPARPATAVVVSDPPPSTVYVPAR
jgi:type IV pilus biogenesis protein CpaD/CtpE